MFKETLAAVALSAVVAASPVPAQYRAEMKADRSFGVDGFAIVPRIDPAYVDITPLGFVRLPLTGGYLYASVQNSGAATYVVLTRFDDDGQLDAGWGLGGSRLHAIPIPTDLENVRIVVGLEGSAPAREMIYLAATVDTGARRDLSVAKFSESGSLVWSSRGHLPSSFALGIGTITAAATGANLSLGSAGLLIAVRGRGTELTKTVLIQALDSGRITEPGGASIWMASSALRVNQLLVHPDGMVDIVGHRDGKALYARYNAQTNTRLADNGFDLPCRSGTPAGSAIDGILRPAAFGADVLVTGRVRCTGASGIDHQLARVSNIESIPRIVWGTATGPSTSTCFSLNLKCHYAFAAVTEVMPHLAVATTPDYGLAYVDIGRSPAHLLGTDMRLRLSSALTMIVPLYQEGGDYLYPYVIGFASYETVSGDIRWGIGRVAADRLFANGVDFRP